MVSAGAVSPVIVNVTEIIISLHEILNQPVLARNGLTLSSYFRQILINTINLGLNQKQAYRHVALILILYPSTQHFFRKFYTDLLE
jgi:hypothetical protein